MSPLEASTIVRPAFQASSDLGSKTCRTHQNVQDAFAVLRERVALAGDRAARMACLLEQAQLEAYGADVDPDALLARTFSITLTGQLAYLESQLDRLDRVTSKFAEC